MNDTVRIFDTTLRDGEQAPGAAMTVAQKERIAHMLAAARVHTIEAGFPIASHASYEAVRLIATGVRTSGVCALARAVENDILIAAEALACAAQPRIHTFIATSPVHMREKLRMSESDVLTAIRASVALAHDLVGDVEWSAEDATRSELPFLLTCVDVAVRAGARTINIPDTVGYAYPHLMQRIVAAVVERVDGRAVVSVHCHNDLGLAVANSLAAIESGARQVECTLNGIGERAGNASLETVLAFLMVHGAAMGVQTSFDATRIADLSHTVSAAVGYPVQPNCPVVGRNAFRHASGIHQDGVAKYRRTYELLDPRQFGIEADPFLLTRHSGRTGVRAVLERLGCALDDSAFDAVFARVMEVADKQKTVSREELLAIVDDREASREGPYEVLACTLSTSAHVGGRVAKAEVAVRVRGVESVHVADSESGEIDACIEAFRHAVPTDIELVEFEARAVGESSATSATVFVGLRRDDTVARASATDTSTAIAALKAFVNALNKLA